jgi:UDP-GlcNAc:undecaprenyl-phosphate/decaprenyl-phosphate GlcNAc-1-phosphate transferase
MSAFTFLLPVSIALGMALIATPLLMRLAWWLGVTDKPDAHRKLHARPIPLGGGVSVFLAMVFAVVVCQFSNIAVLVLPSEQFFSTIVLLGASTLIVGIGLVDDRFGMRGRHKLLGQIAVCAILVNGGFVVRSIGLFGFQIELGILAAPLTAGWLLLAMNALNLIDGSDGLATMVGGLLSATLCCMAVIGNHGTEAVILAALSGALLGFLPYNFPPARVYLGDAGSMLIGMLVGALAIRASLKGPTAVGLAAPLAIWTIPLLDTFAAIIRRKLTGRSIYTTDRGHLHHCLQQATGSTRRTLYVVTLACAATCMGGLASLSLKNDLVAIISAVMVMAILVVTRSFGHGEVSLLAAKLRSFMRTLSPSARSGNSSSHQHAVRLQGTRPWEGVWDSLLEVAEEFHLTRMCLDVNIPACQEGYHVAWQRSSGLDAENLWHANIPLFVDERPVGRLVFAGPYDGFSVSGTLTKLMEILPAVEDHFRELSLPARPQALCENGGGYDKSPKPVQLFGNGKLQLEAVEVA